MPVTYLCSTGALSFEPVALRDQAIGPIDVALVPTPPDEIIAPAANSGTGRSLIFRTTILIAALAGMGALLLTA